MSEVTDKPRELNKATVLLLIPKFAFFLMVSLPFISSAVADCNFDPNFPDVPIEICPKETPVCTRTGACVECETDSDCPAKPPSTFTCSDQKCVEIACGAIPCSREFCIDKTSTVCDASKECGEQGVCTTCGSSAACAPPPRCQDDKTKIDEIDEGCEINPSTPNCVAVDAQGTLDCVDAEYGIGGNICPVNTGSTCGQFTFACTPGTFHVENVEELKDAINAANNTAAADTIVLESKTYTLTEPVPSINGPNGLPSITSPLTILVEGKGGATIERVASNDKEFRILHKF